MVIENKIHSENKGKKSIVIQKQFKAKAGCFALEKEVRDILWPSGCTVISVEKKHPNGSQICEDDTLVLHCRTFDEHKLNLQLEDILGKQS